MAWPKVSRWIAACLSRVTLGAALCVLSFGAHGQSAPQKGYEFSGLPRTEFLLDELRALVGRNFWVRRPELGQPPKALFCDSKEPPVTCPSEKYSMAAAEQFAIEALLVGKTNPAHSWFRIKFASGKIAYLSAEDFRNERYNEGKLSPVVHDVDTIIANSGWIFDDYPPRILGERRAQLQALNDPRQRQAQLEKERILRHSVLAIGMTPQQVLNTSWGPPNSITNSTSGWRRLEQWDYGGGSMLYFEDGRLQRIHPFGR